MTDEEFEKLVKEYQDELESLKQIRIENSRRRSKMTKEEFINDYVNDLNAVYNDAIKNGVDIVYVGDEEI